MNTKENVKNIDVWMRGFCILIYAAISCLLLLPLIWLMVIFQFFTKLITSELNEPLLDFSTSLSRYVLQILSYITFDSEERPFPFGPWPATDTKTDSTKNPRKIADSSRKTNKKKKTTK